MKVEGNFIYNANYGGGVFNRRIRLRKERGSLHGALEDCFHGFQVRIYHDESVITDIQPEFMRFPFSTCDSAGEPLKKLIGLPLTASLQDIIKCSDPMKNCTHLYDLTTWTIAHSQHPEQEAVYDVVVTDEKDGVTDLTVSRNGEIIHQWQAKQASIVAPASLEGKSLFRGFYQWVNATFSGLELEAALVLQKGNLVSIGRRIDVEAMAGGRAIDENDRTACHTYSPEHSKEAIRLGGTVRDFTEHSEDLLKFL